MNLSSPNLFVLDQLFGSEAFTHTGVTKLKIKGEFSNEFLDNFVVSFPNLEQLKIRQCSLSATHFSKICKGFPKLTELVLSDHYEIEVCTINIICYKKYLCNFYLYSFHKKIYSAKTRQYLH